MNNNQKDLSNLSQILIGHEGWRIEVETTENEKRRFIVGRSNGIKPVHLEIKKINSSGGHCADKIYNSVRRLYKVY